MIAPHNEVVKEQRPPVRLPAAAVASQREEEESTLRLSVHDLSRIEWTAVLGLPPEGERKSRLQFTVEIPLNLYSPLNMWDYVQQFTRLQSPEESGALQIDRGHPDELRRDVLGVTHRLKLLRERFERTTLGAASMLVEALDPSLEGKLTQLLDEATAMAEEVRTALLREPSNAGQIPRSLQREWELADEWISHQLLDFLAAAQRALNALLGPNSRLQELDPEWTDRLSGRVAQALAAELRHREHRGLLNPRPNSPAELSAFVERGSHLKKHFQDVLFLDVQAHQVDYRVRNWTAIVAASLAAIWWLGFTIMVPIGQGVKVSIGLVTFFVMFSLAYALKDRLKEITRFWLAGRLTALYGQRMVTLRLPPRVDPQRQSVLEAREKFDVETIQAEDPLNQVQATRRAMRIRYSMRAEVHACPNQRKSGIQSLKHIFRWDLTPIFSRLDNAVKAVPVLDPDTRRVKFVDAPKEYRIPIELTCESLGRTVRAQAQLVMSKRGLERLENLTERAH
jgi:hypothetical protein